jgi:hypothetical protein
VLDREGHRLVERAFAQAFRDQRLDAAQEDVHAAEEGECKSVLMRRARREPGLIGRLQKQLVDAHALGIARARLERQQHQQRHDDGAAPVGDLHDVEGKPLRQQHHLDRHRRHGAPGDLAVECESNAREHVGERGAAMRADRLAGAAHVLGIG